MEWHRHTQSDPCVVNVLSAGSLRGITFDRLAALNDAFLPSVEPLLHIM